MSKNFIPLNSQDDNGFFANSKHPRSSSGISRLQLHRRYSGLNRYKGRITTGAIVLALLAGSPFAYKSYSHNQMETQTRADAVKRINDANKPYLMSPVYNRKTNTFYDRLSPQGWHLVSSSRHELLHNHTISTEARANEVRRNSVGYNENTALKAVNSLNNDVKNQTKELKKTNPSVKVRIRGLSKPKSFLPNKVSKVDWQLANLETKNFAQHNKNLTGQTVSNSSTHTVYAYVKPALAKSLGVVRYAKQHHVMGKVLKVDSDTTYNKINHTDIPSKLLKDTETISQQSDTQGINIVLVSQTPQTKVQKAKAKIQALIQKVRGHVKKRWNQHKAKKALKKKIKERQQERSKSKAVKPSKVSNKKVNKKIKSNKKHTHVKKVAYNAFNHNGHSTTVATPISYTPSHSVSINVGAESAHPTSSAVPNFIPNGAHLLNSSSASHIYNAFASSASESSKPYNAFEN